MFFILAFYSLFAAQLNIDFQAGFKYDYAFNSSSSLNFRNGGVLKDGQRTFLTATVSLYCTSVIETGYNFDLLMTNVHIIQQDYNGNVVDDDSTEFLQAKFAKYYKFTLGKDGNVYAAFAAADEDANIVDIKSGIIGQFIFSDETADNQGLYKSAFSKAEKDDVIALSRTYTKDNFIAFHHPKVAKSNIAVEGSETKNFQKNLPQSIQAKSEVFFSGQKISEEYKGSAVSSSSIVSLVLNNAGKSAHSFFAGKLTAVTFFDRDYYLSREEVDTPLKKEPRRMKNTACPNSSLDLCEAYANTWNFGNDNFGGFFEVAAVLGINDKCPATTRNYVASAETALEFWILNTKIPVGNISLGYGYVDGVPQQNGASFVAFNKTIFEYDIPTQYLCQDGGYDTPYYTVLAPEFKYTYYVLGVLPITFEVGLNLSVGANFSYGYCDKNVSAFAKAVPYINASAYAAISASIAVVKGGIKLEISGSETVDPAIGVDGPKCELYLTATIDSNFDANFSAWFQYWDWVKWSDVKSLTLFDYNITEAQYKLLDYHWTLPVNNN